MTFLIAGIVDQCVLRSYSQRSTHMYTMLIMCYKCVVNKMFYYICILYRLETFNRTGCIHFEYSFAINLVNNKMTSRRKHLHQH